MAQYVDPILKLIKDILDKEGPEVLRGRYGYGDPGIVSKSQIGRGIAFLSFDTDYTVHDSAGGEIESNMPIALCVVVDMTRDFNQGADARSHSELVDLVAGRNPDMTLKRNSIIGALRANQDPNHDERLWIDAGERTTIEFDAVPRDKGIVTAEAIVRFTVKHSQFRPDLIP